MDYFYGPVPSRRLGFSLGVDLTPKKICTFDCLYCQLGRTTKKTIRRFVHVNLKKFKEELKRIVKRTPKIDYITISGSGEPTLHKNLDKIISIIKNITANKYSVCVITNSSLMYRDDVRKELMNADLIIPSLDAAAPQTFYRIDKPHRNVSLEKIIEGLIKLRKEFKGKIWLEIMLVGSLNDTLREARKFKKIIQRINPDKIQLNIPVRPPGVKIALPGIKQVKDIKKIIGAKAEIVSFVPKKKQERVSKNIKKEILNFLKRRPANLEDLEKSLGLDARDISGYLRELLDKGTIRERTYKGKNYFVSND
jgi:wyosine [tRNA(Phe)-imidazoG37] synthetase (radical SAM superfamily)